MKTLKTFECWAEPKEIPEGQDHIHDVSSYFKIKSVDNFDQALKFARDFVGDSYEVFSLEEIQPD